MGVSQGYSPIGQSETFTRLRVEYHREKSHRAISQTQYHSPGDGGGWGRGFLSPQYLGISIASGEVVTWLVLDVAVGAVLEYHWQSGAPPTDELTAEAVVRFSADTVVRFSAATVRFSAETSCARDVPVRERDSITGQHHSTSKHA